MSSFRFAPARIGRLEIDSEDCGGILFCEIVDSVRSSEWTNVSRRRLLVSKFADMNNAVSPSSWAFPLLLLGCTGSVDVVSSRSKKVVGGGPISGESLSSCATISAISEELAVLAIES